jgi:leucyl-tRNA synthetase
LDDANFDELVANSAILRLFVFEKWIQDEFKKAFGAEGLDFNNQPEHDNWDKIFENEINLSIEHTTKYYNEIKYKQALKSGFFEIQNIKDDYVLAKKG